jgi:uncharacterized protein (DUF3820 family)
MTLKTEFNKMPLTEEQKSKLLDEKLIKYQNIKLNFGKHSGKTLDEIQEKDPKYLIWLRENYKTTEKTSPTMKAILLFANERLYY